MNTRKQLLSAAILTALLAAGGTAMAQSGKQENDAVHDLAKAKVTLTQAIAKAEAHAKGRATQAEIETERGKTVIEVEVVSGKNAVYDVTVDAVTGKVLSSELDKED